MKKLTFYLTLTLHLLYHHTQAQNQPLLVGAKLPDTFWQQEHSIYSKGTITKETLAIYRDKLLIIDFWATWCTSCIKKFALADSLHQLYGDQVKVLLVNAKNTKDSPEKIAQTLARYGPNLQTLLGDTLLKAIFPQVMLPHYVWIEQGQVRAITGTEFFTSTNVSAAVERRKKLNELIKKRKPFKP
jgi:thiol-disulfide isomerase/thioredoxin